MSPLPWNQAFARRNDGTAVAGLHDVLLASTSSKLSATATTTESSSRVSSFTTSVTTTTPVTPTTTTGLPSSSPTVVVTDSSSKTGLIAVATVVPVFCIILTVALYFFIRRRTRRRLPQPSPRSADTFEFKMSPNTVDRMQYPPIHDQHTKPLPEPSSQHSKPKSSPNRFTLLSSVSIGSGIPSFKIFGRKPSISTFASASSPHLPDLPITANEPLTSATFEDEDPSPSVPDHGLEEPLSRRTTIRTQASVSEFGTGPNTLFAQSGIRMSRFFPFLHIDPAATSLTRSASPVPSSSVSTRHTSLLPPYHSPSVYNYAVPFDKLGTASIVSPDTMSLASHRASVISTQFVNPTPEKKKRPSNLSLLNRLPQRKTTLFGPRSPSSLRATSLNGGVQTTTSPLSLTQEVGTLFPSEDDAPQSPPPSGSPRSSRPFAGPRPRPAGSSNSTTASLTATSPQSLPDNEGGSPPLSPRRPLPFVPQESSSPPTPTPKPKKRRSLISRLSGLGRSSSTSSRSRSAVEAQRLEDLSFSADDVVPPVPPLPVTTSESSQQQQQQQQRSLPFVPPQPNHTHSPDPSSTNSESNVRATPSIRRKLPDPTAVPAAVAVAGTTPTQSQSHTSTLFDGTNSKRIRPPLPLPPIPNSEDPNLTS